MIGDRQTAAEDNDADDEDGRGGVGHAIVKGNGAADRLQGQERDRAQSGVGDPGGGPAPRAFGCKAQRVVLQRLVGNPLIILAPDAVYPLPPCQFELLTPDDPLAKSGRKNLRRYFAVQYTRSCVSVHCTISAILAPPITRTRNTNGVDMSDDNKQGLQSAFRRKLLMGMAAIPALTMLPRPSFAQAPATSAINFFFNDTATTE